MKHHFLILFYVLLGTLTSFGEHHQPLTFKGTPGKPGNGKHIVLIAGDEEYRSEESCPMLAKILSKHHGFDTTVLFSINAQGGYIDPNEQRNIPHTEAVKTADLLILGLRFRNLPDQQLQPLADYLNAGKPILGFRTSTHAFKTDKNKLGGIDWTNFGSNILGEGWVNHHGRHRMEGARGEISPPHAKHPILRGVSKIFAESDVYGVRRINPNNAIILVNGIVTENLLPDSADLKGKPSQPAIWLRSYQTPQGKKGPVLCSTMGSSCDLNNEGLRRLFINASFHLTGLEVPAKADVSFVDPFKPSQFAFIRNKEHFKKLNLQPADFGYGKSPSTSSSAEDMVKDSVKRWKAEQKKNKKSAQAPAPKVNSTITSVQEQQQQRKRPKYLQPKPLKGPASSTALPLSPQQGETIVFLGNSLAQRMIHHGHLEGLIYANFPEADLTLRNMGFPGHTPAFRPEAGNNKPWAFPGGRKFRPEIKRHLGNGHYPHPDEWLRIIEAGTIVAFFGFNESFDGLAGVDNFRAELSAFVDHTLSRAYNGKTAPRLILATPIATENLPQFSLPDARERNTILAAYAQAVKDIAAQKKVGVLDLFTSTSQWKGQTINGIHLSGDGYAKLAPIIYQQLFGKIPAHRPNPLLAQAIEDKNWFWKNDYRVINGVHVYGRRWAPYGNFNYPEEIEKIREMTVLRDQNIWKIAQKKSSTLKVDDAKTRPLSSVKTNYRPSEKNGALTYLEEKETLKKFTLPKGYKVSTFATEKEFPNLANPMQMRFDNRGRMWVSTMPSYPHYRPGDPKPTDKILIYEDTNDDGRADKEIVWADNLSIPIGFDFAPHGGIYLADGSFLVHLQDTDGDDRADKKEYLLDGFDTHDSHHASSAFTTDHGGGLYMLEGRFLHSQIETPYGPQRTTDGGVWRWNHHSWLLERVLQRDVSNPWGIVFDEYGQDVLNDASGGVHYWMAGYGVKVPHAFEMRNVSRFNFDHHVRPTSGSEFLYSSHFPDEVQGDYLYGNNIGYLGIKQLRTIEDGSEIKGAFRQNLLKSSDGNFRPADLELAPDGSLYLIDWHNALIGHMQHSGRDPNRSPDYGRIYRVTYPSRPLVTPPQIAEASVAQLFENLYLPELQARKRSHRELRGRSPKEVIPAALAFAQKHAQDERLVLEALWATWGQQKPQRSLIEACLNAKDHRIRAAATRVVRHTRHLLEKPEDYLLQAAQDPHPRVRMEALNASTWLGGKEGAHLFLIVASQDTDKWIRNSLNAGIHLLRNDVEAALKEHNYPLTVDLDKLRAGKLSGAAVKKNYLTSSRRSLFAKNPELSKSYRNGHKVFEIEGSCGTCHQGNGKGLAKVYPPIAESSWVTGSKERLIKLTLHGIWGKIEVNGEVFDPKNGIPPMTALGPMFSDQQIADVLTYVRNSWGNAAGHITAEEVKAVRATTKARKTFYTPEELLAEHPFPKKN